MSVFPEFIQHIHDINMYVPGHNYEEMYNIMVYNLTYNIIPTNNFVYTYAFMNQLYDYLEDLLMYSEPDVETNNLNLPINDVDINDIYTNEDQNQTNQPQDQNNQTQGNQYNQYNQNQDNQTQNNENQNNQTQDQEQDNQNALQLFHNYIITMNNQPMNNQPMNNLNYTNAIPNNFTYSNLVYYNNI